MLRTHRHHCHHYTLALHYTATTAGDSSYSLHSLHATLAATELIRHHATVTSYLKDGVHLGVVVLAHVLQQDVQNRHVLRHARVLRKHAQRL